MQWLGARFVGALLLFGCGQVSTSAPTQMAGMSAGGQAAGGAGSSALGGESGGAGAEGMPRAPFLCGGALSVSADELCDGKPDCPGGNDEWDCPRYFCANGASIGAFRVCDGNPDCLTGEDEHEDQCATVAVGFRCTAIVRVPPRDLCNGKPDCANGADEAQCPAFLCHDGAAAIAEREHCNGVADCADGSDELNCEVP
jgi:low-density lipoprotein receptor class A